MATPVLQTLSISFCVHPVPLWPCQVSPCFKNLVLVASDWVPKVMGWIQTDLGLEPSTAFFKLILGKLLFHCDGMKVSNINRLNSTTFPC